MRKLIAILLLLACVAAPAMAEPIDLEAMTLQELLDLRAQIDSIVAERVHAEDDANLIYQGAYVVGKDIVAGYYLLSYPKRYTSLEDEPNLLYSLYESEEAYGSWDELVDGYLVLGQSAKLELKDGMVFWIRRGTGAIVPATKPAWAP